MDNRLKARLYGRTLAAYVLVATSFGLAKAAEFIPLGTMRGYNSSYAFGVSDDGAIVAGTNINGTPHRVEAFRWTDTTGMVGLGRLPDGTGSHAGTRGLQPLSADGSTIVGNSWFTTASNVRAWSRPFIHTSAGMISLGDIYATEDIVVSRDGSVVAGRMNPTTTYQEAFRWTEDEGVIPLGFLPGHTESRVEDISDSGSIVLGKSFYRLRDESGNTIDRGDWEVFTWTETGGMEHVPLPYNANYLAYLEITNDGKTIAGSILENDFNGSAEAFYWTAEAGVVGLGEIPSAEGRTHVRDMTPDGRLIVGAAGPRGQDTPFVWSEAGGMEDFKQVLIDHNGLGDVLDGWRLWGIQSVSGNGQFFAGYGLNPNGGEEAWLVRLDAPWGATAIPEPTTAALALVALVPMTLMRRWRAFGAKQPMRS